MHLVLCWALEVRRTHNDRAGVALNRRHSLEEKEAVVVTGRASTIGVSLHNKLVDLN